MDNPKRMLKRCQRDLQIMSKNDSGIFIPELVNNQLDHWLVSFQGAKDTLYQGEHFRLF